MNLSTIGIGIQTGPLFGNFAIQLNATLDPYVVVNDNGQPRRINKFMLSEEGKLGRITQTGWSFNYSFQSTKREGGAMNDINNGGVTGLNVAAQQQGSSFFNDPQMDPTIRRQMMTSQYYDFDIPWNFGFSYSMSYGDNGLRKTITQNMQFNGSVNLTPKWGLMFTGGYDFQQRKISNMMVNMTRDLHCWQMNFSWVPIGTYKSWSFNIGVKSAMLKDLKYDKRNSYYDNLYN